MIATPTGPEPEIGPRHGTKAIRCRLGGAVIVGVRVDYSDNHKLFEMVHEGRIH